MRKRFVGLASLIMSLIMCFSFLGGCNLVTVDNKRDMNQKVATIQISQEVGKDTIYKKDIIMSYINYGYMYEYNYGYSREKVMNLIINQLITNRVYVQNAIIEFNNAQEGDLFYGQVKDSSKEVMDLTRYLTEDEQWDAIYKTRKDINAFIENNIEDKVEDQSDTLIGKVRAVPTNAKNAEKELSLQEKKDYKIDKDSTAERREAYNAVIETLEKNELLGDEWNANADIEKTTYYDEVLKSYQETIILENYEKCIKKDARKTITYQHLQDAYEVNYGSQLEMTDKEFSEKLSSATIESPVLIGKDGTYGYVYNLLLGASENQTKQIGEIKEKDIVKRAQERKTILDATMVKDLRSTWVLSGYDFDGTKFTGDYAFLDESLPFKGNTTKVADATEDKSAVYKINSVSKFNLNDFVSMMEEYVYGGTQTGVSQTNPSVYKKVNASTAKANYDERIKELLFAFSTDDGSLNTYKGYAIEPTPEDGVETYMQEFADAGRELLSMGKYSYIMVATDYGYHIMFYSQTFNTSGYASLEDYLNFVFNKTQTETEWQSELATLIANWDDENTDTNSFLYKFFDSISSEKVNKILTKSQNKLLNDHVYNKNGGVTRFESNYADLMKA